MAARAGRPVNLWRINDAKANRHGPRHKIAFVRRNPNYAESVKQGKPEHAFKTGKTYAGDWVTLPEKGGLNIEILPKMCSILQGS